MVIKIPRSQWYRGKGGYASRLLIDSPDKDKDGKRCCLGHVCSQLGVPDEDLKNVALIRDIVYNPKTSKNVLEKVTLLLDEGGRENSYVCDMYRENDDDDTSDETREQELKRLFSLSNDKGHTIEFVD